MFNYLILQLIKLNMIAPYPVVSDDRLYFTLLHDGAKMNYYIYHVAGSWTLICYTYQHNAPSILNSAEIIQAGNWRRVISTLANPLQII